MEVTCELMWANVSQVPVINEPAVQSLSKRLPCKLGKMKN